MAAFYNDVNVANTVEKNIENFAKAITDSYFQTHDDVKTMNPATYAHAYFTVFKESLQAIEKQIEATKQTSVTSSIFK